VKPETRTVVAGKEFDRGGNRRFWVGNGYRKAWTTPVELPVLNLKTEAGGLTPLRLRRAACGSGPRASSCRRAGT
jgi:hypothetical protein